MKTWLSWASLALLCGVLTGCASFGQTEDQSWSRKPGSRLLGNPEPVEIAARQHWQYAWLSEAAYQKSRIGAPDAPAPCSLPDKILEDQGWSRWKDFPQGELAQDLRQTHLRVDVWYHRQANILAVAFGGTVFTSGRDWRANLRWFMPSDANDQYSVLVRRFIPALQQEFHIRSQRPDYPKLGGARIVATGHSLGGGLAQEFAYALVIDPRLPRVSIVYAFDPSPVTGFFSVDKTVRDFNIRDLKIERIYERGEALAALRSIIAIVHPPSSEAPTISETRYALFWTPPVFAIRSAVDQHSLTRFATEITKAAQLDDPQLKQLELLCPAQTGVQAAH